MKKKKLQLSKLPIEKNVVATLNVTELSQLLGGAVTNLAACLTRAETCETRPYTQMTCVKCPD
ncbi:hypothetical protein LX64_01419 [Chitinophaga skermanii]|uniref:Class I lanthipeptide n=1 Tax=Chitinophaga skermanii TaxID=331697 RepID=A0A327QXS1_9BACT|nr:class I lanthipeptide [Chitinophaga skermanii]RAJ08765.1 hypothetical protein LX64_01419 [Chitinophaga skermanii]